VGGRAQTTAAGDFQLNLGPHALYNGGAAARTLDELGIPRTGGVPATSGAYALDRGTLHPLRGGIVSLLTTSLFGLREKMETARVLVGIPRVDATRLASTTLRQWLGTALRYHGARRLIEALFRLATYAHAPDTMSAGLAVSQLQLALAHNVRYLDGGWGTLVDGLRDLIERHGGRVRTGAAVVDLVRNDDGTVRGVRLRSGEIVQAGAVIVALEAAAAAVLLPESAARRAARAAVPVRAACLDVGLARLPRSRATFALGVDEPLYCSVHSAVARLAPEGGATIHLVRYLGDDTPDASSVERQLEGVLDRLQPGWRAVVVERRFLPRMTLASALVTATGWLADASVASGALAARLVVERGSRAEAVAA